MKLFRHASIFLLFCSIGLQAAYYSVSGNVYLENQTDHSGVKVVFYNLPSMEPEDSTTSQANGYYSINISPGYYLVEWTKSGYVPWELGGFALAENTVLDPITLLAGEVQEVSGDVSGTWTAGFVYYVIDSITVPTGQTLTIDAGVRVKFTKGKSLICNGKLIVNGTAAKPVLFTSREPTPLPGDWGNVILNTGDNSLNYLKYEYATDGIVGNNASNTTIDHLTINGNLALTARGIYFTNSQNLSFTNNFISVAGEYGTYADNSDNSTFSGNAIITPTYGLRADGSDNSIVTDNTITTGDNTTGPKHAIYTPNSPRIHIENNTIVADENGIYTPNSYQATISNNHITGRIYWNGIQFTDSDSSLVSQNYVHRTKWNGNNYDWQYLINGYGSEHSQILKNDLYFWNDSEACGNMAIRSYYSCVDSNIINLKMNSYRQYVIHDDRNSTITNNQINCTLYIYASETAIILSYSDSGESRLISNNRITLNNIGWDRMEKIIWCQNNKIIRNNKITANYIQRAIYCQSNCEVDSNEISGDFDTHVIEIDGNNTTIHDNKITQTGSGNGIYVQGQNGIEIKNNTFKQTGSARWLVADNSQIDVHHNVVTNGSGRGAYIYNQSGGSVWNNTLVSKTSGDYGIYLENQTNIPVYNNVISGFQNGLYADNTIKNYNLDHNAFWNLSGVMFNGSAIPPLAGQIIDDNANGDPSDIYENINLNPQFVHPDTNNYQLLGSSPCINAGKSTIKDPDSTVADIGALYYPIYIVINHTQLTSTDNTTGPYEVNAEIISPSGLPITAWLHYSTDNQNFTPVQMEKVSGNDYAADIPGQPLNTTIYYYIQANDGTNDVTAPRNIGAQTYSFFITLFSQFANLGGQSDVNGKINLGWATPIPISGTLTGLKLYRSLNASCELIAGNLYQTFTADITQYTDADVEEAVTYYYRLTGLLDRDGVVTESVVSSTVGVKSDDATLVRVRGTALLKDAADHSGTKIYFEKASPSAVSDSAYTDSDGSYDKLLVTGIYNAHFTHEGYQPQLRGNQFFADNADLDTVTLVPGGTVSLSGNIQGTLTSNNLYFVDGNITVPQGDTLTIEAGTQVLFRGNYSLTADGRLFVNGTPDNKVIFSSRRPVPAVGDWGSITLNSGAGRSVLKYAEYKYATDGFVCNNLDSVTIWGMEINTLAINARGITLNNCENVDIRYNTINVAGDWAIKKADEWDNFGKFIGNKIITPQSGMYIRYFYNLTVDSNLVDNKNIGIRTDYSRQLKCRNNTITGQDHQYGIHAYDCDGAEIAHNKVNGAREYGYYLNQSDNGTINDNEFYYLGNDSWVHGFYSGGSNNTYNGNRILIDNANGENYGWIGFYAGNSNIYANNQIDVWHNYSSSSSAFKYIDNSTFKNNNLKVRSQDSNSEWSAYCGNNNTSENDTLILGSNTRGYYGSGWKIKNCIIKSPDANSGYEAIYCTGGTLEVANTIIENCYRGIYGTGAGGSIQHTFIKVYGSDYGLKFESNSTMNLYQNTLIGNGAGSGIVTTSNATLKTNSNLIHGFTIGVNAESQNTIQTSLFYNNTNHFTGSVLPAQIGQVVTVNGNATPSDIYGNIFLDPQFMDPSTGDYSLKSNSPAINAGDIDSLDVDGTVADIGAYPFNFGFVPQHVRVDSTGNGYVAVSWEIEMTDSLSGYQPYYKLSSVSEWIKAGQTNHSYYTFSGLTNNQAYDFCVAAKYGDRESIRSKKISARAGMAILGISPEYIIGIQDTEEPMVVSFTLSNTGTKDLEYSIYCQSNFQENISGFRYLGSLNDHHYYYSDYNRNWVNAKTSCEQAGGHLVTLTSQAENDFVLSVRNSISDNSVFIGLSDQQTEGTWRWVNGETASYTNWSSGQPDNSGDEDFAEMLYNGCWNDISWTERRFILEIDPAPLRLSQQAGIIPPNNSVTVYDTLMNSDDYLVSKKIFVKTNNLRQPLDSLEILYINGIVAPLQVTHFTPVTETNNLFYIVVDEADIDGTILQTGDEIAVFDGETCVGAAGYNGSLPFVFPVYGKDGAMEGYTEGDSMSVQIWDSRYLQVATCRYEVNGGCRTFHTGGFARLDIKGTIYKTLQIPLTAGRFNLISSHLFPRNTQIESIVNGLSGLKILYQDNGNAYIPQYNLNSIGDLDISEGYHVFIDGSDQILNIDGINILPENWQLLLQSKQFNSIATLYDIAVDVTTAFQEITEQIDIVQDDDGGVWIPEMGINSLGNLNPGDGYQIFIKGDTNIVFYYPAVDQVTIAKEVIAGKTDVKPEHFQYVKTGFPYTVVVQSANFDQHPFENGDEIGVYANGLCVGAGVWQSGQALVIPTWKSFKDQKLPGYQPGEQIKIRGYSRRFRTEFEMNAQFAAESQKTFEGASYSVINASASPELIPQKYALKQNYPNPFNPTTVIPFDIPTESKVIIIIYNMLGEELNRIANGQNYLPGHYQIMWDGCSADGRQLASGIYFVRMVAGEYQAIKKMILLK